MYEKLLCYILSHIEPGKRKKVSPTLPWLLAPALWLWLGSSLTLSFPVLVYVFYTGSYCVAHTELELFDFLSP